MTRALASVLLFIEWFSSKGRKRVPPTGPETRMSTIPCWRFLMLRTSANARPRTQIQPFALISCLLAITAVVGCSQQKPIVFEPNTLYAYVTELEINPDPLDIQYSMDQGLQEAQVALQEFFGTPDEPQLPSFLEPDLAALLSMDHLTRASGASHIPERGLYRKHCASCHGESGSGRGPNAAISNPYPRDFRMGKFKFKSTNRGAKPEKSDLHEIISNGIAGTTMVRIPELTDIDIESLVDYVIYLSWRGEVERLLLREASEIEFDSEDADQLRNLYAPGTHLFEEEQLPLAKDIVNSVGEAWLNAGDQIKSVPAAGDIPTNASLEELIVAANSSLDSPLKASIERGRELFVSEAASCSKCHGVTGHGDGQNQDYDDWTKDWTTRIGMDPNNEKKLIPFLARGGLPPRKILPRDFREGVYRGGGNPQKLYHRIAYGIDGTPMPSIEGTIPEQDIWHLVNYVRSLAEPSEQE